MKASSLISAVEDVLLQGCALLGSVSREVYSRREDGPHGSSIGAHYRHIVDHFLCLLDGIRTGQIDYDQRRRSPELESSADVALLTTEKLIEEFRNKKFTGMVWQVLDWNEPAINFYKKYPEVQFDGGWINCSITPV